ncbi:MAG TPA: hypothetical protein VMB50_22920 [Myxococcales bacterium]|nr:hypothetical protein [Myxococcales bacterium]
MFQQDAERIEVAVQAVVRRVAVYLCWGYLALVIGATVVAALPPGLAGWADRLAPYLGSHHHRHREWRPPALLGAQLRPFLVDAVVGAWVVAAVLFVGLLVNWRKVFGLPQRWGS